MTFTEIIKSVFTLSLAYSTIRISLSIVYAGMGEMIIEKSGVLNIGVEGIMSVWIIYLVKFCIPQIRLASRN